MDSFIKHAETKTHKENQIINYLWNEKDFNQLKWINKAFEEPFQNPV